MPVAKRTASRAKGEAREPLAALPAEAWDTVPRVQLTLTDETAWLTRFDPKGAPTLTYPVSIEHVAGALAHAPVTTGLLPPDTLFWARTHSAERMAIYLPPAVRRLHFDLGRKSKVLNLPLPGMVFLGEGNRYYIYAVTERPLRPNAPLHPAPLPNVDGQGKICAGTVKFPRCAPDTIHQAAALFFESGFNHDLSSDKFRATEMDEEEVDIAGEDLDPHELAHTAGRRARRREKTLFQFLSDLQGQDTFPLECLMPSEWTLNHLMRAKL